MERELKQLVERLTKTLGDRLVSVILYGSAAGGDYHARFSDLNIFCVLGEVTPRELGASEPVFRWWRSLGNPAPLLMGEREVRESTDCFPIEFHDMKERRRLLYGADVVADLAVDDRHYRAQVEHELRAKLLRLRQKSAGVLFDRDLLVRLMADSVSTFCVLIRHALRLAGVTASFEKRPVLEQAHQRFGLETAPFLTLLDLREGRLKPGAFAPAPLLEQYLNAIQTAVDAVNHLKS